jgi:NAD(P)-dependent dehydrogenase (short-subunit alcohol dehydrogenase family)
VSSLLGVKGGKGSSAYAASKAGIIGLAVLICGKSLADRSRIDKVSSSGSRTHEHSSQCHCARLY